ncbi:hypothetical protein F2P81_017486 [Scophthalmus maximus]|uniref:Uncharacterized protein n=1 Tax=Scophthalmus maximus TaxID=52904 RepID=A0A6A4SE19_SCOMX|nr:hypothetical protein F2P81_017486 [Scophthalmus maximus]
MCSPDIGGLYVQLTQTYNLIYIFLSFSRLLPPPVSVNPTSFILGLPRLRRTPNNAVEEALHVPSLRSFAITSRRRRFGKMRRLIAFSAVGSNACRQVLNLHNVLTFAQKMEQYPPEPCSRRSPATCFTFSICDTAAACSRGDRKDGAWPWSPPPQPPSQPLFAAHVQRVNEASDKVSHDSHQIVKENLQLSARITDHNGKSW